MAAHSNRKEKKVDVLSIHGQDLPSIANADSNDLKKYNTDKAESSYWLSEEDIIASVKLLSAHSDVYTPGLGIPVINQNQFSEAEQIRLQKDFEDSNEKLFFVFEQVKTDSGPHWKLHSWQKDENGSISKNIYDSKGDGRCGDRAVAKAYRLAEDITGENIAATKLDLFEDASNCSDVESLRNKNDVRKQTIKLIRGADPSLDVSLKDAEIDDNHAEQEAGEIFSERSPELPAQPLTEAHIQDQEPAQNKEDPESYFSAYIIKNCLFGVKSKKEQGTDDNDEVKSLSETLPDIIKDDGYEDNKEVWVAKQRSMFEQYASSAKDKGVSDSEDDNDKSGEDKTYSP